MKIILSLPWGEKYYMGEKEFLSQEVDYKLYIKYYPFA